MTIAIAASITGGAQTGFTTPGYTMTADTPPDVNSKQSAVTALTGTQAGVVVHSVSAPFTITVSRPKVMQQLGKPNPVTGLISSVPRNVYKILTRKGVQPLIDQPYATAIIRTEIEVPAGSDSYDIANLRAALSAHIGELWAQSAGIGDTTNNGIL
nr:MAG: hypothetical protein 2 [Leviviridae sp.]